MKQKPICTQGMTKLLIVLIVAIGLIGVLRYFKNTDKASEELVTPAVLREVSVASVSELNGSISALRLSGKVESQREAVIKTEAQGEVKGVYVTVGQYVSAGRILAEIENSTQRAAVLQAQGAVDAADVALSKVRTGARDEQRDILEVNLKNAEQLYMQAKTSAINTLTSAFASADDALRGKIDPLFTNPQTNTPELIFSFPDQRLEMEIERTRIDMEKLLVAWSEESALYSTEGDIHGYLDNAAVALNMLRVFFDDIARAVNPLTPDADLAQASIDAWKGAVLSARSSINASLSSISLAQDNLTTKEAAVSVAEKNLEEIQTGERVEDVLSAQAALKQAQGALYAAEANLEKTLVRAPISGTVNTFDVKRGDFVNAFQNIAVISNNSALEVVAYITEENRKYVSVGSEVQIDDTYRGVVTRVSPALDEKTKKIEVVIGLTDMDTDILNGQSVRLSVDRSAAQVVDVSRLVIPIEALNVGTNSTGVFTVSEEGLLVKHEVVTGPLIGESIIIESGLDPELEIVLDARGLKEGQEVTIAQ